MKKLPWCVTAAIFLTGATGQAMADSATTSTYTGNSTTVSNCIPFGCPDTYGPNMGFVYKNISAFSLKAGDIIAFDTGAANDTELHFDLSLSATATNGGFTADSSGFTVISSLASGNSGDSIPGNYDIAFVANKNFNFVGGGLIVNFTNTNGAVSDTTYDQNLVYSSDNSFAVGRYYSGLTVGDMSKSGLAAGTVGNMRIITTAVPEPETYAMLLAGLGMMGFIARRRMNA